MVQALRDVSDKVNVENRLPPGPTPDPVCRILITTIQIYTVIVSSDIKLWICESV